MKVLFLPSAPPNLNGPYMRYLVEGLSRYGVELAGEEDWLSARWLWNNRSRVDILHFQWTHYHYTRDSLFGSSALWASYIARLLWARLLGYHIIWTMHNFMPHERPYPLLSFLERFAIARLAQTVIVHCEEGRRMLAKYLVRRKHVEMIPHGDFAIFFKRFDYAAARKQLSISDGSRTFLFFGGVRTYKGVLDLIRAFHTVEGEQNQLLIVGQPYPECLGEDIRAVTSGDQRIRLVLRYISDEELAVFLSAADVAVLPFRDILTSGSAITALSFGLPVVAPNIGCLPEIITSDAGILYNHGPGQLTLALGQMATRDLISMREAARHCAAKLSWDQMVNDIFRVYQAVVYG